MFDWQPISATGLRSIEQSTARLNIWDGAVRSSKTICSIIRWIDYVATAPPGQLMMFGKTERTLKRNILDPLRDIVGRKYFQHNRGMGEAKLFGREVIIVGANDERSEGKIRGWTGAGAYGDELSLIPESFFQMTLSRLSVPGAKLFGTTNPDNPHHWLKKNYLDREGKLNLRRFHFTLDDNISLSQEFVDALKAEYVGLWYKRFILGLWVAAEGAIYDMLDEDIHVVDVLPRMQQHWVGVDYGTSGVTCFWLLGQGEDGKLYFIDFWRHDVSEGRVQKSDLTLAKDLDDWLASQYNGVGVTARVVIPHDAASFVVYLQQNRSKFSHIHGLAMADQSPGSVLEGIRDFSSLLTAGLLFYSREVERKSGLAEVSGYVWDPKAQEAGEDKPLKQDDHDPDAQRYVIRHTRNIWYSQLRKVSIT